MASRKIEDLVPELQVLYRMFATRMSEADLPYIVTSTLRTPEEQYALWMQGRFPVGDVNDHRRVAGLPPIDEEHNDKVTWTIHSKHSLGQAFDIAIVKNGQPTWDLKADVNLSNIDDYEEAGIVAQECGLTWGGNWHDYCHFQLKETP